MRVMIFGRKIQVGLDIGSHSLQWAALDLRSKKSEVWRADLFKPGEYSDPPKEGFEFTTKLVNHLQSCNELSKYWNRQVVVGVQGVSAVCGYLEFPKLRGGELDMAVLSSVSREIPFAIDLMDVVHLPVTPINKGKTAVFYSVWPKAQTRRLHAICEACDLKVRRIESTGIALTRELFRNRVLDPNRYFAIVNVGHELSQVVMVKAGYPYYLRDIPLGGKDMTDAIALRRRLSLTEAEQAKGDSALFELMSALSSVLSELGYEVSRTLKYFCRTFKTHRIDQVFLSGGGALLQDFPEWLEEEIGIPVIAEDWDRYTPKELAGLPMQNKVALGLAMSK